MRSLANRAMIELRKEMVAVRMDQQKQIALLMDQVQKLTETVQELKQEIAAKDARIAELEAMNKYLTAKLYAPKSEKVDPNQLSLLGDDSVFTQSELTDEQSTEKTETAVKDPKKKRQTRQEQLADLPVTKKVYHLDQPVCPNGHQLSETGKKFVRKKLHFQPAKLWVEEIYQTTYKCQTCSQSQVPEVFYQPQIPQGLFAHSLASAELLENIVYQKYVLGTPLYRQLKDWHRLGWQVSESTLADWVIRGADLLKPLYQLLHQELLQRPFLQGDETVIQVLHEPQKKPTSESRMWIIRTPQSEPQAAVFYAYRPDRSQKSGQKLYAGFAGVLQCDGYAVYNSVDCQDRVGCLAHVRRKFFDANQFDKNAREPLRLLNQMFKLEVEWKSLTSSERQTKRLAELQPLLADFWTCLSGLAALPKSPLGKAITYALGQKNAVDKLVDYGAFDLSNNTCEQAVKSLVIDRKNFLFSTSITGAKANAIWLTLIESAKANDLDPEKYLIELLKALPHFGPFPTMAQLEDYLPWNRAKEQEIRSA